MLVLPRFDLVRARTEQEAVDALAEGLPGDSRLLAGGTDLLPNMKRGLHAPRRLVALRAVTTLRDIRETEDGGLEVGAMVSLARVASHPTVRARYPALARAASLVAGPQLRGMGTLGGNVCLDTRCRYYDQTAFWRAALGHCLKKDGTVCHVVEGGRRCVAANSADTPAPLVAYHASLRLRSAGSGLREVPLASFYRSDGAAHLSLQPGELVTAIVLPPPVPDLRSAYRKLSLRKAVDFPLLSLAVAVTGKTSQSAGSIRVVVSGLGSRPRVVDLDPSLSRTPLDAEVAAAVAEAARKQSHPLDTVSVDASWRREMVAVEVRRAFSELVASEIVRA